MRTVVQKAFQIAYRTKNQGVEGWYLKNQSRKISESRKGNT